MGSIHLLLVSVLLAVPGILVAGTWPHVDEAAPDFSVLDVNGKSVSLSSFQGQYVVLEWVNYDCPFIRKHYGSGNMQRLQNEYTEKGVIWLSICSSAPGKQGYFETRELKERMEKEGAAPTAYLLDSDGKIGKVYDAKTTPHMFIINPEGILVYAGGIDDIASTNKEDLVKATNYVSTNLDALLAGKSNPVKGSRPYGCSVKYK